MPLAWFSNKVPLSRRVRHVCLNCTKEDKIIRPGNLVIEDERITARRLPLCDECAGLIRDRKCRTTDGRRSVVQKFQTPYRIGR